MALTSVTTKWATKKFNRVLGNRKQATSSINSILQCTASICFYSFPGDGEYLYRVQLHASALTRMVANHTLNSASHENSVTTTPIVGSALGLLALSPMSY